MRLHAEPLLVMMLAVSQIAWAATNDGGQIPVALDADNAGSSMSVAKEGAAVSSDSDAVSILMNIPKLRDVRPPIRKLPLDITRYLLPAATVLLFLILVLVLLWRICKSRCNQWMAMRSLDRLSAMEIDHRHDVFRLYCRLNLIMRRFIKRGYSVSPNVRTLLRLSRLNAYCKSVGFEPLSRTNRELLDAICPVLRDDCCRNLRDLLEECDLVKFAGYRPEPTSARAALERARAFVKSSSRVERSEGRE